MKEYLIFLWIISTVLSAFYGINYLADTIHPDESNPENMKRPYQEVSLPTSIGLIRKANTEPDY